MRLGSRLGQRLALLFTSGWEASGGPTRPGWANNSLVLRWGKFGCSELTKKKKLTKGADHVYLLIGSLQICIISRCTAIAFYNNWE